jgi:hypothetical protein
VQPRLGFAFDNTLIYVKGGYAFTQVTDYPRRQLRSLQQGRNPQRLDRRRRH